MSNPETVLQSKIMAAIGAEPGLILLRNAQVNARVYDKNGKMSVVKGGLGVGTPDLVGILAPRGRWVCFEVKTSKGSESEEQVATRLAWEALGALMFVVRSPEEAVACLQSARKL